jgi:hypothetical protein
LAKVCSALFITKYIKFIFQKIFLSSPDSSEKPLQVENHFLWYGQSDRRKLLPMPGEKGFETKTLVTHGRKKLLKIWH